MADVNGLRANRKLVAVRQDGRQMPHRNLTLAQIARGTRRTTSCFETPAIRYVLIQEEQTGSFRIATSNSTVRQKHSFRGKAVHLIAADLAIE